MDVFVLLQAMFEELNRKAVDLEVENDNLKKVGSRSFSCLAFVIPNLAVLTSL